MIYDCILFSASDVRPDARPEAGEWRKCLRLQFPPPPPRIKDKTSSLARHKGFNSSQKTQ